MRPYRTVSSDPMVISQGEVSPVFTTQPVAQSVSCFVVLSCILHVMCCVVVSLQLCPGDDLTLTVHATGVPIPTYQVHRCPPHLFFTCPFHRLCVWLVQWYKDGEVLPEESEPTLTISPFRNGHAGSYNCLAFNAAGTVSSSPAQVTGTIRILLPIILYIHCPLVCQCSVGPSYSSPLGGNDVHYHQDCVGRGMC